MCLVADITPAPQHQLVGQPKLLTDKVTIYGSAQRLQTVDSVLTETLVLKDVKDSSIVTVSLAPVPGLRFAQDELDVQVLAEQFTEKVFVKHVIAKKVPAKTYLRLFPSEVNVMLRIGMAHFNEIDENDVEVTCDFPQQNTDKLLLHVNCHNPYVTFTRCNPPVVEFLIEKSK